VRRALARQALGEFEAAVRDFEKVRDLQGDYPGLDEMVREVSWLSHEHLICQQIAVAPSCTDAARPTKKGRGAACI